MDKRPKGEHRTLFPRIGILCGFLARIALLGLFNGLVANFEHGVDAILTNLNHVLSSQVSLELVKKLLHSYLISSIPSRDSFERLTGIKMMHPLSREDLLTHTQ